MNAQNERRTSLLVNRLVALTGCAREAVQVVRSPLRVCPLGAHVDHQFGAVTGFAIDAALMLAFCPRDDGRVVLASRDFPGETRFDLDAIGPSHPGEWGNFARGAAQVLRDQYQITTGLTGVVGGPLPVGGLSSSAAVDVAYLLALEQTNHLHVDRMENMRLAQQIENGYIGLHNGILDEAIILLGRSDALTCVDCACRTVDYVPTPADADFELAVVCCGRSRTLVNTDYNQRVAECCAAATLLREMGGMEPLPHATLSDVPREVWEAFSTELPPGPGKRARHYFGEQERVRQGAAAWSQGDLETFGELMRLSGESSIYNYECGSPELIALHDILNHVPGVLGARFCGAGFGGSAVALAHRDTRDRIAAALAEQYTAARPALAGRCELHFVQTADAAEADELTDVTDFQGVILAAGAGKRLRPLSLKRSKALAPLCGKPMVQWVLESFLEAGINDIVVVVASLDDEVAQFFRAWPGPGKIQLAVQPERRGSAHALACAAPYLNRHFLQHACDTIIEASTIRMLLDRHVANHANCTLALEVAETPEQIRRTGIVDPDGDRIRSIIEKPEPDEAPSNKSAIPVYVFESKMLTYLPEVQPSKRGELEIQDPINMIIARDGGVFGYMVPARWQITTCDDLRELNREWLALGHTSDGGHAGRPDVAVIDPVNIGPNVVLGSGCAIGPNAVLESGAKIGAGATVRESIVVGDAEVADGAVVDGQVVV